MAENLMDLGFIGGQMIGQEQADQSQLRKAQAFFQQTGAEENQAQTAFHRANTQKLQSDAASRQKMLELMVNPGAPDATSSSAAPASLSAPALRMFDAAVRSGNFEDANKYLKTASEISTQEATAEAARARTQVSQAEVAIKRADRAGSLLNGVTNLQTAVAAEAAYQQEFGQSLFGPAGYTPENVDFLRKAALTVKQRADLQAKEIDQKATERRDSVQASLANARISLLKAQKSLATVREEAVGKVTGTKAVPVPNEQQTRAVRGVLVEKFGVGTTDEGMKVAALAIASRANALRLATPGLDFEAAVQRALASAEREGDIQIEKNTFRPNAMKFLGAGKLPETAMALPPVKDRIVGRYYQTPKGIGKYLGNGQFEAVPTPLPAEDDE